MILIKTLINVDMIYTYLMKLKLNLRIGPDSIFKKQKQNKLFMVTKISAFTLQKNLFICWKKPAPPHQKPNGLAASI